MWDSQHSKPDDVSTTLEDTKPCPPMYPNITEILNLLLLTYVTSSGVESAKSLLKFIQNAFRSTMREDQFNALVLLYVPKAIELDIDRVVYLFVCSQWLLGCIIFWKKGGGGHLYR